MINLSMIEFAEASHKLEQDILELFNNFHAEYQITPRGVSVYNTKQGERLVVIFESPSFYSYHPENNTEEN